MKFKDFIQTEVGKVYKNESFESVGKELVEALSDALEEFCIIEEKEDIRNRLMMLHYSITTLADNHLLVTKRMGTDLQRNIAFLGNRFKAKFSCNNIPLLHSLLRKQKPTDPRLIGWNYTCFNPLITRIAFDRYYGEDVQHILTCPVRDREKESMTLFEMVHEDELRNRE